MPLDFDAYMKACTEEVSPGAIHAIACSTQLQDDDKTNWVTALTDDPSVLTLDSVPMQKPTTPQIRQLDIATAQRQDKAIGPVMAYLESGKRPTSKQTEKDLPATKQLFYDWKKLKIGTDGILRWLTGSYKQIVLPKHFHRLVYRELHEEMGHLGAEKVTNLARQHFFWPKMQCLRNRGGWGACAPTFMEIAAVTLENNAAQKNVLCHVPPDTISFLQ